jgi:Xaa-Pro aminopeptidase
MMDRRYPQFSPGEMNRRWKELRRLMADAGAEAAVVRGTGAFNREIQYLSDWPGGREGYLFFPATGDPALLVQLFNHVPMARRISRIADTRFGTRRSHERVAELCRNVHGRVALIGAIPYQHMAYWREQLPGIEWIDIDGPFREMLALKSGEELERIRTACALTDASMERLEAGLKPGLREYELPALIEPAYLERGGQAGIHFLASMPMREPDVCVPLQYPSMRGIARGDVLITEISGAYWGYSGQVHRAYFVAEPPTPAWQRLHDVAVEAYLRIEAVVKDGATVGDVLDAADYIHKQGYSIYDDLLHGLNQLPPIMRTRRTGNRVAEDFVFREDMVVVIQPNVITPDERMGLQFGEAVRVTRSGTERLHRYRREPIVCGV